MGVLGVGTGESFVLELRTSKNFHVYPSISLLTARLHPTCGRDEENADCPFFCVILFCNNILVSY